MPSRLQAASFAADGGPSCSLSKAEPPVVNAARDACIALYPVGPLGVRNQ